MIFLFFLSEVEYIRTVESLTIRGTGIVTKSGVQDGFNFIYYKTVVIEDGIIELALQSFFGLSNTTSITMADSVTTLGSSVFEGCDSLITLVLSKNINLVGNRCFYGCRSLVSIDIPWQIKVFPSNCFDSCNSLQNCNFPSNTIFEEIGNQAFQKTTSLASFTFPETLKKILYQAFIESGLSGVVYLGYNLNYLEAGAFSFTQITSFVVNVNSRDLSTDSEGVLFSYDKLTLIYYPPRKDSLTYRFPDNVNAIYNHAFRSTYVLETVILPPTLDYLSVWCFASCPRLKNINSENIVTLKDTAFYGTSLEAFNFIKVTKIDAWCFANCGLKSVTLYEGLLFIGESAFRGLSLSTVHVPDSVEFWGSDAFPKTCVVTIGNNPLLTTDQYGIIYFDKPPEPVTICYVPLSVSVVAQLPARLTYLGIYAFQDTQLSSINLHEGITGLGEGSFLNCKQLTRLVVPSTVQSMSDYAFQSCTNLKEIILTLPSQLNWLGKFVFCLSGIIKFDIPASVVTCREGIFINATSLEEVSILGQTPYTPDWFLDCHNFYKLNFGTPIIKTGTYKNLVTKKNLEITILNTVQKIESAAFLQCSSLESITFETGCIISEISSMAFSKCILLSKVNLPPSITVVTASSFSGCSLLTEITLNNNLYKTIDKGIYKYLEKTCILCPSGLETFNIQGDTLKLGNQAFFGCEKLRSITLGAQLNEIKEECFYGCILLETVQIPKEIKGIGASAFGSCDKLKTVIYCGEKASQIMCSGTVFPEHTKVIVGGYFQETKFCGKPVIKSTSYGPDNCPLVPTEQFSIRRGNSRIFSKMFPLFYILQY